MHSPRILHLLTRMNVGGPARHVLDLARGLPDFSIDVAAGEASAEEGTLSDRQVPVRHVPLVRPIRPATDARAVAHVRRLLRRRRIDLVHTHMAKAGATGRLAASSLGADRPRTVHTFHGHVLEAYFSPAVEKAFIGAERFLARRTDLLLAVSGEIRDALLDLGIGRPEQYRIVPLGLDFAPFLSVAGPSGALRRLLDVPEDVALVGVVGRLAPVKDHRTLLRALRDVPDVHLAIVGDGELREELEAQAASAGMSDRVHFTGWRTDLPEILADLDAVTLTSRNEGTPVALIEAAAAGRPVVATDVGGVASVVQDGETGLLVPAGDPGAIADALKRLLADPALGQRFGRQARSVAQERFGIEPMLEAITEVYRELLG